MKQEATGAQASINTRAAWQPFLKPIGRLVIAAQLALVLQPLSALAQEPGTQPFNPVAQAQLQRYARMSQEIEAARARQDRTPADAVSDKLAQAQELVAQLKSPHTPGKAERHQQLKDLLAQIGAGAADVRAEFAATRAELQRKNLPPEILARHDEAVGQFEQGAAGFAQIVSGAATDDERVAKLAEFFDKRPAKRKPGKRDAKKLPWSTPQPNTRMPAETQTAWYQNLWGDQKVRLAQAGGGSIGPLNFTTPPEPGQAPTTADLAETDEVQITAAIRAKAQELGNNPVNIYNWVRNSIEFAPTAGAIQSAQDALDKKRGNATDTASLLIALLRAANIPARYQWGTIDVDAEKAQNWVGGVTRPEAALQLLGQGGIAARGMASGGRITAIRMEHVWVQAYVNWSPSRGSRNGSASQHPNPNAPLNAWVPLDASFKQYSYTPGMNFGTLQIDGQAFFDAAREGASVNQEEGWVQNANYSAIRSHLTNYQERLQAHINSMPANATTTVGDVIGKKVIPQHLQSLLAGTLPNPVVLQGSQAASVPSSQQHKFTYLLYASDYDRMLDSPMLTYTEKTSRLAGRRLMLTYVPASQADADLIASYMPKPHADGSPIQPSELPTSLPGYLIRLKARISLEGEVVAQSEQAVQMGTDLYSSGGFTQLYDRGQWDLTTDESNVAGQTTAIGISAGGVSAEQLARLKERLRIARQRLAIGGAVQSSEIAGDVVSGVMWGWFAAAESHNRLSQNQAGMVEHPGLSYGLFHVVANPVYSWGVIRKVTFPGVNLDVGHVRNLTWSRDGDSARWVEYNQLRGEYMSALEHGIPERFFNDPSTCNQQGEIAPVAGLPNCPQGISAVKAIGLAGRSGQKIYSITRDVYARNPSIVGARLHAHSAATRDRIQQALDAGFEVTIHEAPVAVDGWSGAGYVFTDPSTGAGGYLIEGATNGGFLQFAGALFQDPSLLQTQCGESWLKSTIDRFLSSNGLIPGISLPIGTTLLTAGVVAKELGGYTFFQFARLTLKNPHFLLGNTTVLGLTALVNNILMGLAFEIGMLIGSGISAAICKKE